MYEWDFNKLVYCLVNNIHIQNAWNGVLHSNSSATELPLFFAYSWIYIVIDFLIIFIYPECVKSPRLILFHHSLFIINVILCLLQPWTYWYMGANILVEINTWFIIARRCMHKSGISKNSFLTYVLVSGSYYLSWIIFRLIMFPYLFYLNYLAWVELKQEKGSVFNLTLWGLINTGIFLSLMIKWSFDIIRNKILSPHRGHQRTIDKGL